MDRIASFREQISVYENIHNTQKSTIKGMTEKIEKIGEQKTLLVKAQTTIDKMTQIVSARGIGKIESIVTGGLRLVFGKKISFLVDKKEGARGTSYKMLIKKGDVVGDPFDSFGGGVINVASFLLRIIMIKRFKTAKMVVLDESMNNVSSEYQEKVSTLLKTLATEHGFNILLITHSPELAKASDKVYQVYQGEDLEPRIREINPETVDTE